MNAIAYTRCSTEEQAETGVSLQAQQAAIQAECSRRGWTLTSLHTDVLSGKNTHRPGLTQALGALAPGDALIVAKLDRLTRSVADLGRLLEQSRKAGWSLVALDLGVDTTTAAGELVANVMASVAQWERRAISERTKAGLAARRAQGVRLGRVSSMDPRVKALAVELFDAEWSAREVARLFNEMGLPTPRGGQVWRNSSLRAVMQ